MNVRGYFLAVAGAVALPNAALAEQPADAADSIVVTYTRVPERELSVPAAETIIGGNDLRARGAIDLRSALAPAAGVEVLPGSDVGPASSVVALQGLTELDAYLLVVDGVPFGGAFNPATAALDLLDVDRIEVVRGAAPVTYGATSFVGVIHILRAPAGEQPTRGLIEGGTRDSARAQFATSLSSGAVGQSLLGSFEMRRFSQDRGKFARGHLLYRAATDIGAGRFHLDLDATVLRQTPYSSHPREGAGLSTRFPLDANINPSDARADQDRFQANIGYDTKLGRLTWSTTASAARTSMNNTRGYLRPDFDATGETSNADGFRQNVRLDDLYLDSHVASSSTVFDWVAGLDWLYGKGRQRSANFEYGVLPNGANAPDSHSLHIDESTVLTDRRSFGGAYAQAILRPTPAVTLLAGIRLNRTVEHRCGGEGEGSDQPDADDCQLRRKSRLAGSAGVDLALWRSGANLLTAFADYRNTYKPAAIDFGPEAEGDILAPETTQSWEAGFKTDRANGRFHAELSYFDTRFRNLVIRENIDGLPALASAGRERFRGIEAEFRWTPVRDLNLFGSYAHHLARFTDYARLQDDGSLQQLAGKRLELSPKNVASAGVTLAPPTGPQASATVRYVGSRFLNKSNTVVAGAYATFDTRVGWKFAHGLGAFVEAENLTNRRDPVTESELGDAQFYRLPGRRILASLTYGF